MATREQGLAGLAVLALVLAAVPAGAQAAMDYGACLAAAEDKPEETFERALAWRDEGGGFAARHCAAVALVKAGLFDDGAAALEELAQDMQAAERPGAGQVLAQAGNAWLLAGLTGRAETVLELALELDPENIEALIDRARLYAEAKNDATAAALLDKALDLDPDNVDGLVFRAAARRRLGEIVEAAKDIARAAALAPDYPPALLERGTLHALTGNPEAARRDWLRVLQLVPGSRAAELAGSQLEHLDVKPE